MNTKKSEHWRLKVSAGCHINDVMNFCLIIPFNRIVSAGCHINDVMNKLLEAIVGNLVSAGCHINDVMNH